MGFPFITTSRVFLRKSALHRQLDFHSVGKRLVSDSPRNPSALKQQEKLTTSSSLWRRLSPLHKVFGAYSRAQKERPWVTQVCSVTTIWCCGDLVAQRIGGDDYNPWRTLRHVTIGFIVAIPTHIWSVSPEEDQGIGIKVLLTGLAAGSCTWVVRSTMHPKLAPWRQRLLRTKSCLPRLLLCTSSACTHFCLGAV